MRSAISAGIAFLLAVNSVAAQQPNRVRVHVDYIAERSLYLSAGTAQGLFAGDTAVAYRERSRLAIGRVLIASSTRSRAVALMIGDSLAVATGDVLELVPPDSAFARMRAVEVSAVDSAQQSASAVLARADVRSTERAGTGLTVRGRIGFDINALMSRSDWGDGSSASERFMYTTPVARMRTSISGLPGELQVKTNLRVQYYGSAQSSNDAYDTRVYQASLERNASFLRFQLGRFYNLYESHSGYWDGALLRLGGNGAGAGVAWGFTPRGGNQAFSTTLPKTALFVDLHRRSNASSYDGSFSFHDQTEEFVDGKRNFLGVSQQIGVHGFYLSQRVQVGRTDAEKWSLWQMHSSVSLNLGRPVQLTGRYFAERTDVLSQRPAASPLRARWTGGLNLSLRGAFVSAEGGGISTGPGSQGRVYQGSLLIPRALFGLGIGVNGSRWEEEEVASTYFSPSVDRSFGRIHMYLAGQYNRSVFDSTEYLQQGVELSFAIPIAGRAEALISTAGTRSQNATTMRILTSIWQSF
jgi:hypothetical protein